MFKYSLKKTLSNKMFIFWSLIFPVTLMYFFHLAFGGLYDIENRIDVRDAAVIYEADNEFASYFGAVLDEISEGDEAILNLVDEEDEQTILRMVSEGEISGVFIVKEDTIEIAVEPKYNSNDSMILKSIADYYVREYDLIRDAVLTGDPGAVNSIIDGMSAEVDYMSEEQGVFAEKTDPYNWYYYSTIVMGILFQAMAGINMVAELQADVGERKVAMRTSVSPVSKLKLIITAFLSRLVVSLCISTFSIVCMNKLFEVPVGNRLPQLILFILAANMFALSMGEMFGLFFKGSVSTRGNKGTALIMTSVFISGEMIATLPGLIERYVPVINDINPATVLNMALYRLVYYEDLTTFYIEIVKIILITVVFLGIATMRLRRQKYASV